MPSNGLSFAEFFAGIGLMRMGLERAGWTIRFANDIDPGKLRMYEGHFGPAPHFSLEDVHELARRPEAIPDVLLATASFPCTDLSLAGARGGIYSGESSAFWGFHAALAAVGERRPPLVLIENVVGFLNSNDGRDFRDALRAMNDLGYSVDAFTIDAANFVPQSRPRLFVVCTRGLAEAPDGDDVLPVAALEPSPLRPLALLRAMRADDAIAWTVRALPELPAYGSASLDTILDDPPPGSPEWWSTERAEYLLSQMSERHRAQADAMIAREAWSYGTVFRRVRSGRSMAELRTDGIAGCLRTPKGGSGRQILFQAGFGQYKVRLLNADECARLMGARGFRVTVPLNQALFGFGDAVCVDAVEWIARNYLAPLVSRAATDSGSAAGASVQSPPRGSGGHRTPSPA